MKIGWANIQAIKVTQNKNKQSYILFLFEKKNYLEFDLAKTRLGVIKLIS